MAYVCVISKNGKCLEPTSRCGHVRWLLKTNQAKVYCMNPFTIQLLYDTPEVVHKLSIGMDVGRTNIGIAIVKETGEAIELAHIKTRNKDVPKLMSKRKGYRQGHRKHNRREKRQRRAKANDTVKAESFERILPHYEKPIICHWIKNKEARFCNRKKQAGWLTPTANQLLETHINIIDKYAKYIPINTVVIELNKFDFMKLENQFIKSWQYQNGPLKGYKNKEELISDIQNHHCIFCNNSIEHYHHIVPKNLHGSDTVKNIVGLCNKHHTLVHTNDEWKTKLSEKVNGIVKKYDALSVINQIMKSLIEKLSKRYNVEITDGRTTYNFRKKYGLEKDHDIDAYAIACSVLNINNVNYKNANRREIKQYRRHDRQACQQENINRRYKLGKEVVAINRHRAYEQEKISLEEYVANGGRTDNLTVVNHKPVYKRMNRVMPGAIFLVNGKRKVLKGSSGLYKGQPIYYNFEDGTQTKSKDCKLISHNSGLVFLY